MQYKLLNSDTQRTFAIILQSGDEVFESLQSFAKKEQLRASQFSAIGSFSKATLGFFDFSIKDYKKIEIDEQVEVLNIAGDISLYNKNIQLHAHVIVGKKDGTTQGGHLLKAYVHPTLEIILTESPAFLQRKWNEETGLPLIEID